MTGAVLPNGTDCVIPVERISIEDGAAILEAGYTPQQHQFIHPQGSDHEKGHEILRPGDRISPMDVAIIASCGLETVEVGRQPSIRVISTGNELIAPGEPIEDHQVRLSNGPALVAMLTAQGFADTAHEHLVDDPGILEARLDRLLSTSDVLILSGGVSMGKADYVPGVLRSLGVEVIFHKISQRPGKPMWYGKGPGGQAVFALPGNPVSTLVCCRHYVLPALLAASGRPAALPDTARLSEEVAFKADLTCFMPVRLSSADGGIVTATPVPTNTSGDFAALSGTDGYVELVKEQSEFPAGTVVPLHRWNAP
jgi:molybdopterin molybdotransferase